MGLLETLVEQDFGLELNGQRWARAEEHDSLIVDRERDIFYWNSRDLRGDAYIYLTRVRGLSHDAAKEMLKAFGFSGTFIQEIKDGQETIVYPKLVEVFHENLLEGDRTYFYNRTLTDETIARFQLGFHNGFYMIPITQDGILKNFQCRRDSPKLIKQYYKHVGPLLFNSEILKIVDKVFISEGLIGTMVLSQHGLPSVSMNMGCDSFAPEWIKYFPRIKEIYLLFDRDSAGDFGAKRTAKILGETRCRIYNFWDFDKGYAVDDFFIDGHNKDDLLELIKKESKYAFEMDDKKSFNNRRRN